MQIQPYSNRVGFDAYSEALKQQRRSKQQQEQEQNVVEPTPARVRGKRLDLQLGKFGFTYISHDVEQGPSKTMDRFDEGAKADREKSADRDFADELQQALLREDRSAWNFRIEESVGLATMRSGVSAYQRVASLAGANGPGIGSLGYA